MLKVGSGGLDAIQPALVSILRNVAPHVESIGRESSERLLKLFTIFSAPSFLLAKDNNHLVLQFLLEAINAMVEHNFQSRPLHRRRSCVANSGRERDSDPHYSSIFGPISRTSRSKSRRWKAGDGTAGQTFSRSYE